MNSKSTGAFTAAVAEADTGRWGSSYRCCCAGFSLRNPWWRSGRGEGSPPAPDCTPPPGFRATPSEKPAEVFYFSVVSMMISAAIQEYSHNIQTSTLISTPLETQVCFFCANEQTTPERFSLILESLVGL